jgi:ribonuclease D
VSSPSAATPPPSQGAQWISTDDGLERAARRWLEHGAVALDTEFVRERTFFPRLGLVQVADERGVDLVDPLAVADLGPLRELLVAPGTLKVIHSASEDLEVFYRAAGVLPRPLFDTQIAAGLAGLAAGASYQRLVTEALGVELFKGETRTDWLARPLSEAQLAYAAEDVAYLLPLYQQVRRRLADLGRLEWALEDSQALLDESRFDPEPEAAHRRVRGAGRLDRRGLQVLQALAAWRDREARRRDLPRGFLLRDELLIALASRRPKTARDLQRLPNLDPRQAARDGATWLDLVRRALECPESDLPPEPARLQPTAEVRSLETALRDIVRRRAAGLEIPPELLASRRTLDSVLRSTFLDRQPALPEELRGWRREIVGEELLAEARRA